MSLEFEIVAYGGWNRCARLSNGVIELVATLEVGPRLIRFGFVGGENRFREFDRHMGQVGGEYWRSYGGHRFWHAPEDPVRTYLPDNDPVEHSFDAGSGVLELHQNVEASTGLRKIVRVRMHPKQARVDVEHVLENTNADVEIEAAIWPITIVGPGMRGVVPQEPWKFDRSQLLPVRAMALWSYTDMADPRWRWGRRLVQLYQDASVNKPQKIGMFVNAGWIAGVSEGEIFLKTFDLFPGQPYPDNGCNAEIYSNGDFTELETLGPLEKIAPGASIAHTEWWSLHRCEVPESEEELADWLENLARG